MATPLDRLLADDAVSDALETFDQLPAADLRSLLLHIATTRAGARGPGDLLRQFESDRFCAPAPLDALALAEAEAAVLRATTDDYESVALSPLAPLGTCSVVGPVAQNNVVTTLRLSEVSGDPTNVLALEAARRRRSATAEPTRLAAVQRVTRAQQFDGPRSFAHFSLLGLVSAGRDRGDRAFEVEELARHIGGLAAAARAIVGEPASITVAISDLHERHDEAHALIAAVSGDLDEVVFDPDRAHGVGYYEHLCFKLHVDGLEVGDGGSVPWTRQLLSDRKERLVIAGLGLDRLLG